MATYNNPGPLKFGDPGAVISSTIPSRRLYNFSDRVADLAPDESPFFVYLSKVAKVPTDDPQFRWLKDRNKIQMSERSFALDASHTVAAAGSSITYTVDDGAGAAPGWLIKGMVFAVGETNGSTNEPETAIVRIESAPSVGSTETTFVEHVAHSSHKAHYTAMYLSLAVAALGIFLSFLFYYFRKIDANKVSNFFNIFRLYNLSKNKFYIDEIYSNIFYKPFMFWSKICSKIDWDYYDQKFIDSLGKLTIFTSKKSGSADYNWLDQKVVDGFGKTANYMSLKMKKLQGGVVQSYILGGLVAIILITLIVQQI